MADWVRFVREQLDLGRLAPEREESMVQEIAQVLEDFYREARARGASAAEAEDFACRRLGDCEALSGGLERAGGRHRKGAPARLQERLEEARGVPSLVAGLSRDLLFALRGMARNPGFSAVVVLVLALGIGATTAVFSLAHTLLMRPLPYPEAHRLGLVRVDAFGQQGVPLVTASNVLDFREHSSHLEALVRVSLSEIPMVVDGELQTVTVARVSPEAVSLLGGRPILGRGFDPVADVREHGLGNVLLSEELWRGRLGADPGIVGRGVEVDEERVTVVGVLPAGLRLLLDEGIGERPDLWIARAPITERGTIFRHLVLAKLRPGVGFEEASAELASIEARTRPLDYADPEELQATYRVTPLREGLIAPHRPALLALLAAVLFVLLLVSANVANLLLVRARRRQGEWAVREVLGAGSLRLIRQSLIESAVLAAAGGLSGLVLAWLGTRLLIRLRPVDLPRLDDVGISPAVLGFAALLVLGSALLSGLLPAWRSVRLDVGGRLKAGGRSGSGGRTVRAGRLLAAVEVALAIALLMGAGLMLRTLVSLRGVELGFEPEGLWTFEAPVGRDLEQDAVARLRFDRRLVEELERLPGVRSASLTNLLPLSGLYNLAAWAYDEESAAQFGELTASFQRVFPGYFRTMGIELLSGRDFERADTEHDRDVVIVSDQMARLAWPGEDPVGERVLIEFGTPQGTTENRWVEVVGAVASVRFQDLDSSELPHAYLPYWSRTSGQQVVARTAGDTALPVSAVRDLVTELGAGRPIDDVRPMGELVAAATRETRFLLFLVGAFAVLAVLVACLGVYGVLSYSVSQRSREIGIRMTLGARRDEVFRMVLGQGMAVTGLGVVLGLAAALTLARSMRGLVHGVAPYDPLTASAVVGLLGLIAALACFFPAWRATRVDPCVAILSE